MLRVSIRNLEFFQVTEVAENAGKWRILWVVFGWLSRIFQSGTRFCWLLLQQSENPLNAVTYIRKAFGTGERATAMFNRPVSRESRCAGFVWQRPLRRQPTAPPRAQPCLC